MTNAIIVTDLLAARMIQAEQDFHISRIQSIAEQAGNPQGVDIHYFGNAFRDIHSYHAMGNLQCCKRLAR